jgi:hypothetical protein
MKIEFVGMPYLRGLNETDEELRNRIKLQDHRTPGLVFSAVAGELNDAMVAARKIRVKYFDSNMNWFTSNISMVQKTILEKLEYSDVETLTDGLDEKIETLDCSLRILKALKAYAAERRS